MVHKKPNRKTENSETENSCIGNSESGKLLGINFDCKLTFDEHISNFCKKTSRMLIALARIVACTNISTRQNLL